jgi:type I restriction enzyme R subunit
VLVDEAHRSHTRTLHRNLRKALHNASSASPARPIASGKDRNSRSGEFIDKYLCDSELDGATVPSL